MYNIIEGNNIILKMLKKNNEISGFKLGCSSELVASKTVCIKTMEDKILAVLEYSVYDDEMEIGEFEVIKSQRRQGVGESIIEFIKNNEDINAINLYPADEGAKCFWIKCGFFEFYDETGTMMMRWEPSKEREMFLWQQS